MTIKSFLANPFGLRKTPPVVAVLRLYGPIGMGGGFRPGLNLAVLAERIERAFRLPGAKAVALAINSPGGSPVQSSLIGRRIRQLAVEKKLPVYAFAEDAAASGGYWLACAADEIYADASSIVGSVGVISAGFGFPEFLARHGVERRVYAAGRNKALLDPFQPEKADDVAVVKALQLDVHDAFIRHVKERRGNKLKANDDALFNGDVWTGTRALELGLIDGIGDLRQTMRAKFGDKVKLRLIDERRSWLRARFGIDARAAAAAAASGALEALEERALWARYGL